MRRWIQVRSGGTLLQQTVRAATLLAQHTSPHVLEGLQHVGGCRARDADGRVTPARASLTRDALEPFAPDADAAGHADGLVHHEELAVVARDDAKPRTDARRVEHAHVGAVPPQVREEAI